MKQEHLIVALQQENRALRSQNAALLVEKQKLHKDLLSASDYIIQLEDKCYESNRTSLDLLKQLRDSEALVAGLKNLVASLKKDVAVYIPNKDDQTDL